jgi:phosphomannomutase/phosphomannomutase/phosphoglucomutase
MKFVGRDALPIGQDSGLREIQALAENVKKFASINKGIISTTSILEEYTDKLLTYFSNRDIKPLKIVCNPGNGAAGHVIDEIEKRFEDLSVPIEFIKINFQPDGTFPNGVPNPLLPEYRKVTSDAVLSNQADLGVAWDGDFDRCFLFDEKGQFIEGYYIVGLLAAAFLNKTPGEKIVYDPRLIWNTVDIVTAAGGIPVQCKSGHTFMKERMRAEKAVYGGEMSAHHYFKDFSYCDSGMIPWLLAVELLSTSNMSLSKLVGERVGAYPCSGEINYKVADAAITILEIKSYFGKEQPIIDETDGLSMSFDKWRFNLRASNTEPLLRLNVESKGDKALMREKLQLIENRIKLTS